MSNLISGAALRKWRLEHDLTQKELAKKLGVTQPVISRWEGLKRLPANAQIVLKELKLRKKKRSRIRKLVRSRKRKASVSVITDLKSIRKRLGLSQTEMAELLVTHQPLISRIEHGRVEVPKQMILILKLLSTSRAPRRKRARIQHQRRTGQMTGQQLKAIRKKLDLTQNKLADKLKIHQSQISEAENSEGISENLETKVLALLKRNKKKKPRRRHKRRT